MSCLQMSPVCRPFGPGLLRRIAFNSWLDQSRAQKLPRSQPGSGHAESTSRGGEGQQGWRVVSQTHFAPATQPSAPIKSDAAPCVHP